jgi:hypothetical protein
VDCSSTLQKVLLNDRLHLRLRQNTTCFDSTTHFPSRWCIFYVLIDIDCNFTNLLIPVISVRDLSVNPILFPPVKNRIVDMALSSIHKLEEQLFLMRFTSHSVEASTKIIRIEIHHQSETSMSCKLSCI